MISDERIAAQVSEVTLEACGRLDQLLSTLQPVLPAPEFQELRLAIGAVMGEAQLAVLRPLYRRHPGLRPPSLEELDSSPTDAE